LFNIEETRILLTTADTVFAVVEFISCKDLAGFTSFKRWQAQL